MFGNRLKLSEEKGKIDYEITCINPRDYKLRLTFTANQLLLKKIWDFRKNMLLRQRGIDVRNFDFHEIKEFKVPKQYFNFLKISIKSTFVNCAKIFQKDGIVLLSHDVTDGIYKLNKEGGWDINIYLEGIYSIKKNDIPKDNINA